MSEKSNTQNQSTQEDFRNNFIAQEILKENHRREQKVTSGESPAVFYKFEADAHSFGNSPRQRGAKPYSESLKQGFQEDVSIISPHSSSLKEKDYISLFTEVYDSAIFQLNSASSMKEIENIDRIAQERETELRRKFPEKSEVNINSRIREGALVIAKHRAVERLRSLLLKSVN